MKDEEKKQVETKEGLIKPISSIENIQNRIILLEKELASDIPMSRVWGVAGTVAAIFLVVDFAGLVSLNLYLKVFIWIVAVLGIMLFLTVSTKAKRNEIEKLEASRRVLLGLPEEVDDTYYDKLVRINVDNQAAYYILVKEQTNSSFKLNVWASIIGFILIIAGLVIAYEKENLDTLSYISTGAGLIIEFIVAILLIQYFKTISYLKSFHSSLVNVQNTLLILKLIEDTQNEEAKTRLIMKMIGQLTPESLVAENIEINKEK